MRSRRVFSLLAALMIVSVLTEASVSGAGAAPQDENRKPSLSLRATPPIAFSPARVRVAVEVRGGADDYEEFYCPTVEWDWGDGTISENTEDCQPYEAGKSTIRRRFSAEHVYRSAGQYRVIFKLKRKDKTMAATSVSIQVRPGLREQARIGVQ